MNVKNLVLGIGIIVVYALVLWQGVETLYPSPEYNDFCDSEKFVYREINTSTDCLSQGGKWNSFNNYGNAPVKTGEVNGYCDLYYECNKLYEEARTSYSWRVFLISIIAGVVTFIVGFSILSIEPVGSALIGSGIWAIFWGSVINWKNFASGWRFILLLIALVILIWIALRINKKKK